MTVRSDDGMDELSTTSKNKICLLKNNILQTWLLTLKMLVCKEVTSLIFK